MKNLRIGIRYAKALFFLASEFNKTEDIRNDMALIGNTFKENPQLKKFLGRPIIRDTKKTIVINEIFKEKIDPISLNFILLVIKKRRFPFIDIIADQYLDLYRMSKGIKPVYFDSVESLEPQNRLKIIDILKDYTQKDIELIEEINEELIGGFVLRLDEKLYDASIKAKIIKLTNEFNVNIYEKGL